MPSSPDAKRILPAGPKDEEIKGQLTATILSVYDLPSEAQPSHVSMSLLGKEVHTGPPSAKHRERNSFKFLKGPDGSGTNEVSISAPLDMLYEETVVFKVTFSNHETLEAHRDLSSLQINESTWIILYPTPEESVAQKSGNESDEHQPTLRLKICLSGPYRPEIKALISISTSWFQVIDSVASSTSSALSSVTSVLPKEFPSAKIFLVPAVPLAAGVVALLPILLGVLTVGLPFFLPVLVVILAVAVTALVMGTGVYLSSSSGRDSAAIVLGPIMSTFCATSSGQRLLYETGPRPSPVALAETILPVDLIGQLVVSLVIDFIGSSSYLLPGVGEMFDLAWAPMQTILLTAMYDKTMPSLKYISFVEEIMPFTDVLPSGTLGWVRCWSPLVVEQCFKKVDEMRVVANGRAH